MKTAILTGLLTALVTAGIPAMAQAKASVAEVFDGKMLGTNLRYFESIAGIARESTGDQHSYQVDGCEITATAGGGTISALRMELSPKCQADLKSFVGDSFAPAANKPLTFGSFQQAAGDISFYADCLAMCGNAADPSVYALWDGPRAVNSRQVLLEVVLVSDPALEASSEWRASIAKAKGEDFVTDNRFNCERTFDAPAQKSFQAVQVTAVTIGSELPVPGC
ncbi:hypothetical protein BI292_03300 [Pseudomonas sp. 43NM1]|uniref:hypothetical protein n=1 Tax=Pseudomonas sp. 43NM1 TaxID=1904755 RepID=UPI000C33199D|nr:hypothetical protein [Pseudomonas sp. 43NM1]PKH20606.1 hypothetical protein BI292_03300 [Pseudomonas sp. 43NM1]